MTNASPLDPYSPATESPSALSSSNLPSAQETKPASLELSGGQEHNSSSSNVLTGIIAAIFVVIPFILGFGYWIYKGRQEELENTHHHHHGHDQYDLEKVRYVDDHNDFVDYSYNDHQKSYLSFGKEKELYF